ncbi:KAP family P-loop NTPase fold protein [Shimia sagamensis]|uniref:Predicted P-loop ATPase, KAP-like n=1 Tax=Shimia sagamensis TaxID=1566352 RepID=A0ABY1PM83_9RHOB|nr:KAP family NTPase [Shimia sagamensis]SMP36410.1 Predicted P-loop ATPase, KAP-like [Shimia sagamensis]
MIEDTPLVDAGRDKLGFNAIARNLASAFLQNDLSTGFVVGVEGAWGSGKSSIVNLALAELAEDNKGPKVIKFTPWLVGNRNELLAQLFAQLEPVILEQTSEAEKLDTKKLLSSYAEASSGLAVLADLAEIGGAPFAGMVAKFLRKSGEKAQEQSQTSLNDLNQRLRGKLKHLKRPIVVFVDDLDRLEPSEVVEVLRLVKAVADFPNVAYILAYDLDVLAESVQRALNISDGKSHLEKVVQASFSVPRAMSFDLRNWLQSEVSKLVLQSSLTTESSSRLELAYRQWSDEYIETPRDVVRVVNSLKLNFVPVKGKVDPADMIFLQIIRTKNSALFNWIERYVSALSAVGDWGYIAPGVHESFGRDLLNIIDRTGEEEQRFVRALGDHLPGVGIFSLVKSRKEFKVFDRIGENDLQALLPHKRLASPNHFSYYFSFSSPSGGLDDSEVEGFLAACERDQEKAVSVFREMIGQKRPQGGRLAEILLDLIVARSSSVSTSQVQGLFVVLGEAIDELIPFAKTEFGYADFLKARRGEIFGLIDRVKDEKIRGGMLHKLFSTAKSIAWLSGIIRETTFAHGSGPKSPEPKETWLLSEAEFENCKEAYVARLWSTPAKELLEVPYFLNLMYAWYQLGDNEGPRRWIKENTVTDDDFLVVLNAMTSWSSSSDTGVSFNIEPKTLEYFFDGVIAVEERLKLMSENDRLSENTRASVGKHLATIGMWQASEESSAKK